MVAFVYFAAIAEMAVVERIGKYTFNVVVGNSSAALTALPSLSLYAVVKKKVADVFQARLAFDVKLKGGFYGRGFAPIQHNCFGTRVIEVTHRGGAGEIAAPRFLSQTSFRVRTQIAYVLVGHAKLDRHHKDVIAGQITSVMRLYVLDHSLLQKPTNLSAVHWIACQAINLPTNNALRFAPPYTLKHVVKYRAAGHLCRSLLNKLYRNLQPVALGERAQFRELRVYRENLLVLDIGGFAGVEKIFIY